VRLRLSGLLAGLAAAAAVVTAPAAHAATRDELTAYADKVAAVWAQRQDPSGEFLDPASGRPSGGYGNVMMGYALMRAGERRDDAQLIRAGVRGVSSSLDEPPSVRGVFDLFAVATAYDFARRKLADDPAFRAERRRWERYLRTTGAPNVDNKAQACIVAPDCFHNHEAVGATADLQLLATGVKSARDPATLRANALAEVGVREPAFSQGTARIYGPGGESGLGLLSDTGSWPLAYHALSTAFLGRSIELLGKDAPQPARDALRRGADALAGFMAPDGTVAYIGRRQEDLWSLAAAIAAAELASKHGGGDARARARDQAVASRALDRMEERYPLSSRGLPIVPRSGDTAFSDDGVDGNPMTFNALALLLLNVAADAAPADAPATPAKLPADRAGAFVDADQNDFATVRHRRIWLAVHGHATPPDLRNDFGLVAAKWRSRSGAWVTVVPPRPFVYSRKLTAGPVVDRGGQRIVPNGRVSLGSNGAIKVDGPLPVRFAPVRRGVRISVRAQAGDVVTYTAFVPKDTRYPVRAKRARVKRGHRTFASCCSTSMVALKYRVRTKRTKVVSFVVRAPRSGQRTADSGPRNVSVAGGESINWLIIAITAAVLATFLAVRHRPGRT
jgi:hypothetical protein